MESPVATTFVTDHVAPVIIATCDAIGTSLAITSHIASGVVMTHDAVGTSLAVTGHNASVVVVTHDSICSALSKASTHLIPLFSTYSRRSAKKVLGVYPYAWSIGVRKSDFPRREHRRGDLSSRFGRLSTGSHQVGVLKWSYQW